jgi:plastocyanin domain-containing protein
VGCGDELIFPSDPRNLAALKLKGTSDKKILEFTPRTAGEFEFYCGHRMYRGLLTVTK